MNSKIWRGLVLSSLAISFFVRRIIICSMFFCAQRTIFRRSFILWWWFMGYKTGGNLPKKSQNLFHPHFPAHCKFHWENCLKNYHIFFKTFSTQIQCQTQASYCDHKSIWKHRIHSRGNFWHMVFEKEEKSRASCLERYTHLNNECVKGTFFRFRLHQQNL